MTANPEEVVSAVPERDWVDAVVAARKASLDAKLNELDEELTWLAGGEWAIVNADEIKDGKLQLARCHEAIARLKDLETQNDHLRRLVAAAEEVGNEKVCPWCWRRKLQADAGVGHAAECPAAILMGWERRT